MVLLAEQLLGSTQEESGFDVGLGVRSGLQRLPANGDRLLWDAGEYAIPLFPCVLLQNNSVEF
jgi:hypothetical protein